MKKYFKIMLLFLVLLISTSNNLKREKSIFTSILNNDDKIEEKTKQKEEQPLELNEENCTDVLQNIFDTRNNAILRKDEESIKNLYETDKKVGRWAFEHEVNKMKYLENWSHKQGTIFSEIKTGIVLRSVKEKEKDLYEVICSTSTEYSYSYEGQEEVNNCKIGTNHYLNIKVIGDKFIIAKEWYEDPFADSLSLENIDSQDIRSFILSQEPKEFTLTEQQQLGMDYAHKYCGVSNDPEYDFKFNKEYKNFNPDGGDCANFASQIMFESGAFKKNNIWNYADRQGTKAWVNAQGFTHYILNSQRGSLIINGSYQEIYKVAYNMRPGDFVAYEKGGRITHVSTVTGHDAKGYPLVTCHNTDRLLVPWDLGWSNKNIKYHLVRVHY
ncbi:MAG: amidase domain-containing protein [Peptostreptococcaceae bacterium]